MQFIAPTGLTLSPACSFSLLITFAAVLALGLGGTGRLTLLGACSSWPSARAFLALGMGDKAASHCLERMQPIDLTGVTLAAAYSFSSIIISAAVLALG